MTEHVCDDSCPLVANRKPFYRTLKAGRSYLWCSCGKSARQPFCDGSHEGSGFEPIRYTARADGEEVLFCGCKHSATPPFCDGAHNNLAGGYRDDDAAADGPRPSIIPPDATGVTRIDGRCFVASPDTGADTAARYRLRTLIAPSLGAEHQAQFYLSLHDGASPVLAAPDTDVVLLIRSGYGEIEIGPHRFDLEPPCGVYVRSGEAFRLTAAAPITTYISACPGVEALEELALMPQGFDDAWPNRVVTIDRTKRSAMGPRWFQMLVDKTVGSATCAQFVGHIPLSRAEMHRHLYEEALIILSGEGVIWNENSAARVSPGDVIFFPRKHLHSLECTVPEGMEVVGLIHPGDNPGINY